MFARASCEDGDRSVYFASVRFESASTPLYHEFPFLLPVTVFHPLPIRPPILSSTTMLHRRGTISRTWSEITFLPPWWPLSNELSRRPTISKETISKEIRRSLEGSRRETLRSFKGANLFEYLEETVEIIPCFSRIRVQSPRSIQGRSIDFLPESSTSTRVTWSPTSICHSHVECWRRPRNYWPFDVSIESATSKRTRQWLIDEAIDSTRFEQVTRSRRGTPACLVPLLSPCSLYACLFNRRYPLSSNYTIDPARSRRDVSSCYIFRSPLPSAR